MPKNTVFLYKSGTVTVKILPASARQSQQQSAGIKSALWNEQIAAAQKILLSNDPTQWKKLETFASHPSPALREIAAQALAKKGVFSPTVKTLFYDGTNIEVRGFLKDQGDLALALLASAAVEDEARKGGFKGPQGIPTHTPPHYNPLEFSGDGRISHGFKTNLMQPSCLADATKPHAPAQQYNLAATFLIILQ